MRSYSAGSTLIEIVQGDITQQATDAIVNAANTSLLGGGGVDGAIHRAGGSSILEECRKLGGCTTGDAKITGAGRLPAWHVIHTVGPVWSGRSADRDDGLLANAYRRSLEVAIENGLRSVAFPSISTGAYRFPIERAARIALGEIVRIVEASPGKIDLVRMVLYSDADRAVYESAADEALGRATR